LVQDVVHSVERLFKLGGAAAGQLLQSLVGASACDQHPATCDLTKAVVVDDSADTVTFHLSQPDPDFMYQLASPGLWIVPASTPTRDVGTAPAPGTGPYVIADYAAGRRVELVRNTRFTPWSAAQPAGYPDRMVWTQVVSAERATTAVEQGMADYFFGNPPTPMLNQIVTQYTPQAHFNPYRGAWALYLNTRFPPFDDVRVRRALAFAVDRDEAASQYPGRAVVSCQALVPNFSGYQPYCPYTVAPGPDGTWTAPDLERANSLINQAHSKGTPVTLWTYVDFKKVSEYVASVLTDLGYPTTVKVVNDFGTFYSHVTDSRTRTQASGYWNVRPDPSPLGLLGGLSCDSFIPNDATGANFNSPEFCDPAVGRLLAQARDKRSSDPAAATALWTRVDRALVDKAPIIPLVIPQELDVVSPRVRNYENNPALGVLLDQVWIH
jgi:peptide/nickel transport system substrate-binding protein